MDKQEEKMVVGNDEAEETGVCVDTESDRESDIGSNSDEFNPIEHPVEPTGDDTPAKCPMPESSILFFEERRWEDMIERTLMKRAKDFTENGRSRGGSEEQQQKSTGRLNKRQHQSHKGSSHTSSNIFQIFNQCKLELKRVRYQLPIRCGCLFKVKKQNKEGDEGSNANQRRPAPRRNHMIKRRKTEENDNTRPPVPKTQSPAELRVYKEITELKLPKTYYLHFLKDDDLMNFHFRIQPLEGYYRFTIPNIIDLEGNVCLNMKDWKPDLSTLAWSYTA